MKRALIVLLFPLVAFAYSHNNGPAQVDGGGNPAAEAQLPDNTPITSDTKDLQFKTGDLGPSERKFAPGEKEGRTTWEIFQNGDFINDVEKDVPACHLHVTHNVDQQGTFPWGTAVDVTRVTKKVTTKTKPDKLGKLTIDWRFSFTHNGIPGSIICTLYTDNDRDFTYGDLRGAYGKHIAFDKKQEPKAVVAEKTLVLPLTKQREAAEQEYDRLTADLKKKLSPADSLALYKAWEKARVERKRLNDIEMKSKMIYLQTIRLLDEKARVMQPKLADALAHAVDVLETTGDLSSEFTPDEKMKDSLDKRISSSQDKFKALLDQVEGLFPVAKPLGPAIDAAQAEFDRLDALRRNAANMTELRKHTYAQVNARATLNRLLGVEQETQAIYDQAKRILATDRLTPAGKAELESSLKILNTTGDLTGKYPVPASMSDTLEKRISFSQVQFKRMLDQIEAALAK